ncbi:hypothetical protein GOV04_04420 [Candidatus Woesearchaeota archaeon]|nr:hypothetical protein [Candidatus Woesearchaeota archaeon]
MMKTIILDTNFLLAPGQFKIDIFEELKLLMDEPYELAIVSATKTELEKLSVGNSKDAVAARIAIEFLSSKNLKTIKTENLKNTLQFPNNYADDQILNVVDDNIIVATLDVELQKKILARKAAIIGMRQQKKLYIKKR